MITTQNIIDWSKPHSSLNGGRHTILETKHLRISIVGGSKGLYGDFVNNFEVAIMNKETGSFMTKFFLPESNDDVVGYVPGDELETMLNEIVGKNFQVI